MFSYETKMHTVEDEEQGLKGESYAVLALLDGVEVGRVDDVSPELEVAQGFAARCAEYQTQPSDLLEAAIWYLSLD